MGTGGFDREEGLLLEGTAAEFHDGTPTSPKDCEIGGFDSGIKVRLGAVTCASETFAFANRVLEVCSIGLLSIITWTALTTRFFFDEETAVTPSTFALRFFGVVVVGAV